ncbi:hypothetical protein ACFYY8_19345 [Streptosporangium sp. NPDC001559]|uniref:hypothetical protein n=1 Tax=Streptosporangium sp. NPDC001559 TaxID=3366187 RepID=UPI0036E99D0C
MHDHDAEDGGTADAGLHIDREERVPLHLAALMAMAVVAVLHRAGPQLNGVGQEPDAETETETEALLRIYAKCIAGQDEAAKRRSAREETVRDPR